MSPAELCRDEVAERRIFGWHLVHGADEFLLAVLGALLVAHLLEDGVQPRQDGTVEGVEVGQHQRRARHLVEILEVHHGPLGVRPDAEGRLVRVAGAQCSGACTREQRVQTVLRVVGEGGHVARRRCVERAGVKVVLHRIYLH